MKTYRASARTNGESHARMLAIRAHPLVFGVVLFLASELMFFGGMFAAYYVLRTVNTTWPPPDVHLDTIESSVGTAVLAVSSGTMVLMARSLNGRRYAMARVWVGVTIVLAVIFEAIAVHGWMHNTFTVGSHAYGSLFYMMTGFHVLHVLAGIILMTGLFFGVDMAAFERDERAGAEAISYYWHFVFIVWVLIWGSIYVVR